jgi:6-pyruvoyl-tetrahydropterin synthase
MFSYTFGIFVLALLATFISNTYASPDGFSLGIRDSIMIAHSFAGEQFGPAQQMHGATYTVDVDLCSSELADKLNWVIDIGQFSDLLSEVLKKYNFKCLNDIFPQENTTTEFMCKVIHKDLEHKLKQKQVSLRKGSRLTVKLHESHKAWASYSKGI